MRVVLRDDVETVGNKGDVLEVADGFARNYLIPKGKAIRATPGLVDQAAAMRRARAVKDAKDRESAELVARELVSAVIHVSAKAGAEGKLFGSVTAADVVGAVGAQAGIELDRRKVLLAEPIKVLGSHQVQIKLHSEVQFPLTVEVVAL